MMRTKTSGISDISVCLNIENYECVRVKHLENFELVVFIMLSKNIDINLNYLNHECHILIYNFFITMNTQIYMFCLYTFI